MLRLGITHHDDVGSLPVAPAGGEACVVEDPVERVVGQRLIGEFTNRVGGSHDVVEVHDDHLLAVCRVGVSASGVAVWCLKRRLRPIAFGSFRIQLRLV